LKSPENFIALSHTSVFKKGYLHKRPSLIPAYTLRRGRSRARGHTRRRTRTRSHSDRNHNDRIRRDINRRSARSPRRRSNPRSNSRHRRPHKLNTADPNRRGGNRLGSSIDVIWCSDCDGPFVESFVKDCGDWTSFDSEIASAVSV
jgi:hypothetical protein